MKPFGCLSMAAELGRDIRGIYGVWSKPRISDVERLQVKEGSCTFSFQLIKVGSDVAERFNFGVILGRRELSPNSLPLLNLSTWLMANFLSEGMGLASKESIRLWMRVPCSLSHKEGDCISDLLRLGSQDSNTG